MPVSGTSVMPAPVAIVSDPAIVPSEAGVKVMVIVHEAATARLAQS